MRKPLAVLAAVTMVACSVGGRFSLRGTSPSPPSDLFTVASQQLVEMGYSIQSGDREAGFIVAEKQAGKKGFAENIQVIRVSFSEGEPGASFNVQGSTDYVAVITGERKSDNPDGIVKEDVRTLRDALSAKAPQ